MPCMNFQPIFTDFTQDVLSETKSLALATFEDCGEISYYCGEKVVKYPFSESGKSVFTSIA